jgi:hypothetical protein
VIQVPADLEGKFLLVGPQALAFLISAHGGLVQASRVAEVQVQTLSRWLAVRPSRGVAWYGYPSPLHAFDRIVQIHVSAGGSLPIEPSWLSETVRLNDSDVEQALSMARSGGLSLPAALGRPDAQKFLLDLGIPASTRKRYLDPVPWPRSLVTLDRLSRSVTGTGWPEIVIDFDVTPRLTVKRGAIEVMVSELLVGVFRGPS